MSLPMISQEKSTVVPPVNAGIQQVESVPTPAATTPVVVSHGGLFGWQDVPEDILMELMAWTARITGSVDTVNAMGCVSRQCHAALRNFRESDRYIQSYWSSETYADTSAWVRRDVKSHGIRPIQNSPKDSDDLDKFLCHSASLYEKYGMKFCLKVDEHHSAAYTDDSVLAFAKYSGANLAVVSPAEPWSLQKILQIEKALPAKVALSVTLHRGARQIEDRQFAQFITDVCKGKRPIALDFTSVEFVDLPVTTKALFNALCGQGFVMSVSAGLMTADSAATLLKDLAKRIDHLRHVQLIYMTDVVGSIADRAIQALVRAVAERRDVKSARVNIVIDAIAFMLLERGNKPLTSSEMQAQREKAGLYFGALSVNSDLRQRVMDSTGHEKIGFSFESESSKAIEEKSDSDSIIESSSDDDNVSVTIPSDTRNPESAQRQPPRINEPATEPRVKHREKRDKCVIS